MTMVKIDHVTVAIPDTDHAFKSANDMLVLLGLRDVEPETQYAARNTAWKYRHYEDDNGFKIHVVAEGVDDPEAGPPGLTHIRAVVTTSNFESCRQSVFCERDADSGRIWLAGPGTLRAEVITTDGLMETKRPLFGVEGDDLLFGFDPADNDRPVHLRQHKEIMERALAIMVERDPQYHDSWKNYGWRGAIFNLRRKAERVWHVLFNANPPELVAQNEDDLLDIINYAAMAIACMREENRNGLTNWWGTD